MVDFRQCPWGRKVLNQSWKRGVRGELKEEKDNR